MSITVPAALRLALAAAVLAIPAAPAQAQSTDGPRTRITCDVQRSQRLAFVDNPMAAAGINRKITTSDDATTGRLEIVFAPAGSDGTMAVAATLRDAGKPASTRLSRHPTSEYMLFLCFDPEDRAD